MKIAIFSTHRYDEQFLMAANTGHELTFFVVPLNGQTATLTKGFDAVCVFVNDHVDGQVIHTLKLNGVKLIVLRSAGFNNVDIQAADAAGIPILRVPAYSPQAVAEHAMALILTLNRKTHKAYNRVREGNFSLEKLMGFDLYRKKIAVIGTGKIGAAFCRIALGFGSVVHAFDLFPDASLAASGVVYETFENTLRDADIISLHCPLTPETKYMINHKSLDLLKPGAMLINTSRGALINTADVIESLKKGQLGYLGLDVYEQEEKLFFHDRLEDVILDDVITRLISFPNVLITAHQGFFTREAMTEIAETTFENVDCFAKGIQLVNQVMVR